MADLQPSPASRLYKDRETFVKALLEEAEQWVGAPYRHMGKTRRGCDCIGLVIGIFKNLGLQIQEDMYQTYSFNWCLGNPLMGEKNLEKHCVKISENKKIPGDLCTFTINSPNISHSGMWLNESRFIHSSILAGSVGSVSISKIQYKSWQKTYAGTWRFKFIMEQLQWVAVQQVNT